MTKFHPSSAPVARQLNLPLSNFCTFEEPAGKYRRKEAVQEALKRTLRNCHLSREEIAEEMTRLTSEHITISHISNWTAESKNGWRMPLEYAAAFFAITGDPGVIKAALSGSGIGVLDDKDNALLELGRIVADERKRSKRKRQVMETLGI